jgi:hypothetical protein
MNDEPRRKPLVGRPFSKGDSRINRSGRPRSFDQFRELAQKIAREKLVVPDGSTITVAEAILRSWAKSKEPILQRAFIEFAFGKVPDKVQALGLEPQTTLILHYAHERDRTRGGLALQPPDEPPKSP